MRHSPILAQFNFRFCLLHEFSENETVAKICGFTVLLGRDVMVYIVTVFCVEIIHNINVVLCVNPQTCVIQNKVVATAPIPEPQNCNMRFSLLHRFNNGLLYSLYKSSKINY